MSFWQGVDKWVDPVDLGSAVALPLTRVVEGKSVGGIRTPIEGFLGSAGSRIVLDMMYEAKDKKAGYGSHWHPIGAGLLVGGARALMHGKGSFGHGFVEGVTAVAIAESVISPAVGGNVFGLTPTQY